MMPALANGVVPPLSTTEGLLIRFESAVATMAFLSASQFPVREAVLGRAVRELQLLRSILAMRLEGPSPIPQPGTTWGPAIRRFTVWCCGNWRGFDCPVWNCPDCGKRFEVVR